VACKDECQKENECGKGAADFLLIIYHCFINKNLKNAFFFVYLDDAKYIPGLKK
jgi:hypothetical protein